MVLSKHKKFTVYGCHYIMICKVFVFVTFLQAKHEAPGQEIDGRKIRVDFSITKRAHTPTPGVYLGHPTT